jgi:hypothetical protein
MEKKNLVKSIAKGLIFGLALFVATGAFASNKGSLHVDEATQLNGQAIAAGDYEVRWEGTGENVELSIMKGRKEVAKTPARTIELNQAAAYNTAIFSRSSGKTSISEVRFAGKKTALAIGVTEGASMSGNASK